MSANLYWKPHRPTTGTLLRKELKFVLEAADFRFSRIYTHEDVGYFRGLRDAGIDGAQDVIDAIESNGEIKLFIE